MVDQVSGAQVLDQYVAGVKVVVNQVAETQLADHFLVRFAR